MFNAASNTEGMQGMEFILNFMAGYRNGGQDPTGAIFIINPSSVTSASVKVVTPLITSGPASIDQTYSVSPVSKMRIPVQHELLMTGTQIEDNGMLLLFNRLKRMKYKIIHIMHNLYIDMGNIFILYRSVSDV